MTQQHVRLTIFERPYADFVLRRTLELLVNATRAQELMARMSRFVLFAPPLPDDLGGHYVRCETVEELFSAVGTAWAALSRGGVRHIHLARSASPDMERLIDEAAARMEQLVRPPAANDS